MINETVDLQVLYGSVRAIIFHNEINGYTVMRVASDSGTESVVTGCMPFAAPGETIEAKGRWTAHPVHGPQFAAISFERQLPLEPEAVADFLGSGIIPGVGQVLATRIVDLFGEDALGVLERSPEKLTQIRGITESKAQKIGLEFKRQTGLRRLLDFFSVYGVQPQIALRVYKNHGDESIEMICRNPYVLVFGDYEVDFEHADQIALDNGYFSESPERLEAAALFELRIGLGDGHSFIPYELLVDATHGLVPVDDRSLITSAVDRLVVGGKIVREQIGKHNACYLSEVFEDEAYVAEKLHEKAAQMLPLDVDLDKVICEIENETHVKYADMQKAAIRLASERGAFVLTGGPGTGKTTTLRAILTVFKRAGLATALTAPTGRAAKRMSELCMAEASTIHRLVGVQFDAETGNLTFLHNEDDPVEADAVIVDETSMIDIGLMRTLLGSLPSHCRLVLVGDRDQLPSVGPGNLLSDMLASGSIETVRLTEIFRQATTSDIVVAAHDVLKGVFPTFSKKDGDFFFMNRVRQDDILSTAIELCAKRLPQNMGISPEDIQVLSPMRKTEAGTIRLNKALQAALNPPETGKREVGYGETVYREGDRIMQIQNNYKLEWRRISGEENGVGVFNGDIGTIIGIDKDAQTMSVCFEDRLVQYSFDMLRELEHAFAMTVHKSQGSEYPAVVLVLQPGSRMHINRRLLYTAITRAKKLLVIVGDRSVLNQMVTNKSAYARFSGLKQRLSGNPD